MVADPAASILFGKLVASFASVQGHRRTSPEVYVVIVLFDGLVQGTGLNGQ